jgi:hypothetical protein
MSAKKHIDRPARPPGARFSFGEVFKFILVVSAIGAGWFYWEIRSKREELITRQSELNEMNVSLEETRKRVESRRHEVGALQEKVNLLDTLEQDKTALETKNPEAERELASLRTQMATAVREERAKAAGTMHPELRLVDGEVLTGVRIMSVSDSEMSVAHAGGVARVPANRLPADFQARFRFGMDLTGATGVDQLSSLTNTIAPLPQPGYSRLTDSQRRRVDVLNADLMAKKTRLRTLEKMAARESEAEQPARPGGSMPPPTNSEQQRIQREREKQRNAVDQHVKSAAILARTREIATLRKEIATIEGAITVIYRGGQ